MRGRHPEILLNEQVCGAYDDTMADDDFLTECILKLNDQQRQVLLLKYCHGYDLREIAKIMNITYASARKIDQRGKKKLRDMLIEGGRMK